MSRWLALLALVLGVLVPAASIIWFMTEAASNQADADRQRVSDSLRGQLQLLSEKIDSDWRSRLDQLKKGDGDGAAAFRRVVTSGALDSVVLLGNQRAGYPLVIAPERRPARERAADLAARAAQSQIRDLVKVRDMSGALQAIDQHLRDPQFRTGRDAYGRLIAADARLLMLRLLRRNDPRFRQTAEKLATLVNDYDTVVLPSSQRLFLMGELKATKLELSLPTYEAEQLAAQFLETDGAAPTSEALESTRVRDVWKMTIGPNAVALFQTERVIAMAGAVLGEQRVARGTTFALTPPGREGGTESIAASPLLPGWQLRVSLTGTDPQQTTNKRLTTYLTAGSLAVAGLAVAGLLLGQALRRQIRVNRLKTDLVAAVSHELRTPLTSMRALVDLLLDNPDTDDQTSREYLQMIAGENARLSRLIEHVLTFARVDHNRQNLVFRDVSPSAVVQEAAAVQGRERFPGLTIDIAPDLAPLYGDQDALVTVLLNLLENAYKYSGDDKRVSLKARQDHTRVVIEVEDNGIGIARRERKRIFRPFYQVDQRLARERGGCGLGLSIVDFIVRAHGGQVTVESEPGQGSLFRVVLPSRLAQRGAAA